MTPVSSNGPTRSGEVDLDAAPQGGYDPDAVAATARSKDPGLPEDMARELAVYAWEHLRAVGALDAPEVARRLMADHPSAGATPATVVARSAVDFCLAHGVSVG